MKEMIIRKNVPLKNLTSFKIGGPAEFFARIKNLKDLKQAFRFAENNQLKVSVIGAGSNVLISDVGVRGIVLLAANDGIKIDGARIIAGAGALLDEVVEKSLEKNLRGLESLSGIPGTLGGAVFGNAGMWGKFIGDYVFEVKFFDGRTLKAFSRKDCLFGYKTSVFSAEGGKNTGGMIFEIVLKLEKGSLKPWEKLNLRNAIIAYRNIRYPKHNKSAGSFFKNVVLQELPRKTVKRLPDFAFSKKEVGSGYLLEQAGLAGKKIGRAVISKHQANYFVNLGLAKAGDIIKLAKFARNKVFSKFGVRLSPEVRLLGFEKDPFE